MIKKQSIITLLIILFILFFLFLRTPKSEQVSLKRSEKNVNVVINPEIPNFPNMDIKLNEELAFKNSEEDSDGYLYKPTILRVDKRGFIYICDQSDQKIKIFDNSGKFIKTIGRKGKGPGEFESVGALEFLPSGDMVVLDFGNKRTNIFNPDGTFLNSWKWGNFVHSSIYLCTNDYLIMDCHQYGPETKLFINKYDISGNKTMTYGEFVPRKFKLFKEKGMIYPIISPYTPHSIFAVCKNSKLLYHCLNHTYNIEIYNTRGKRIRTICRPEYKLQPYTKREAEMYFSALEKRANKTLVKLAKKVKLPKSKTIAERVLVDDQGNLWVHTNERQKRRDNTRFHAYDIFNKDGKYQAKIWINVYPFLIKNKRVYTIELDDDLETYVVKRFYIEWHQPQ